MRLNTFGSCASNGGVVANILTDGPRVTLYVKSDTTTPGNLLTTYVDLDTSTLYDGDRWNLCFGRIRNDEIDSDVSSSYFIRVAKQEFGDVSKFYSTSSFFAESFTANDAFENVSSNYNQHGAYITVGTAQTLSTGPGAGYAFLNNTTVAPASSRITSFDGSQSHIRFWSTALSEDEWKEHVRNFHCAGVEDPLTHYDYAKTNVNSFERLRLDTINLQPITSSDGSGKIMLLDYSDSNFHMSGTGFTPNTVCFAGTTVDYSIISPSIDDIVTPNKVRARGLTNIDDILTLPWVNLAPVYEIPKNDSPIGDTRMAIEISLIDALNRDIITMFSSLDAMENAIGAPENAFSPDYPDLARMSDIYFNRIVDQLNFKSFFEFYRWLDASVGNFIKQLIPRKTRYKGINFVIEPHMLERAKVEYLFSDMYMYESQRTQLSDERLLQQVSGTIVKY
jgi:hypothetical protein